MREIQRLFIDAALQPYNIMMEKTIRPRDVIEMRAFIRAAFGE
jgi:hypothetical protein